MCPNPSLANIPPHLLAFYHWQQQMQQARAYTTYWQRYCWQQHYQSYLQAQQTLPKVVDAPMEEIVSAPPEQAPNQADDLKRIEGIGPKIEQLMNEAGIYTWADLAAAGVRRLRKILADAGNRYAIHDPGTWPKQAKLAAAGKMQQLDALQEKLKGGK